MLNRTSLRCRKNPLPQCWGAPGGYYRGCRVTMSGSTMFFGGASTDLALNVHIEAEGTVNAACVLQASTIHIQLKLASATRLEGQADGVDATAGTVKVLGIVVNVTDMTHFEDHGSQKVNTF